MSAYGDFCRPKLADLLECIGLDITYTRARGAYMYRNAADGSEVAVLDLVAGFGTGLLGHNNSELRDLIKAQLDAEVPFMAQSAVRAEAGKLAKAINQLLPTNRPYLCHLSNSGAEAMEAALKHAYKVRFDAIRRAFDDAARSIESFYHATARDFPDIEIPGAERDLSRFRDDLDEANIAELERFQRAPVVLALKGAFHGKTATALKVTFNRSYREGFEGLSAVQPVFIDSTDVARLDAIVGEHAIEFAVPRVVNGHVTIERSAFTTVLALCLEVIQGEGGVRPLPDAALACLAEQHARAGVPFIIDEIQTGCGRTGSFVAYAAGPLAAIDPEYITLSKGLGGGIVKVAATLIRDDVYDPDFGILHTSTFAEDETGCVVARRVLDILARDDARVMREVTEKGDYLYAGLRRLHARFPRVIGDVRGRGLMLGLEFADLDGLSPLFRFGARQGFLSLLVASYLLHRRNIRILAPLTTLLKGNPGRKRTSVLRIQPPVEITYAEIDDVLSALAEVCALIACNNEGALVAHLIGVAVTDDEIRQPQPLPVPNPRSIRRAEFDARIGFVMHPGQNDHIVQFYFPSLVGRVDARRFAAWWSRLSRFLEPDVVHVDYIGVGGFVVEANLVCIAYLPRDLADAYRAAHEPAPTRHALLRLQEMQDRIQDAVTVARELGDDHIPTSVVGLGAYTSVITERGTTVNDYEIPVTTGNAYTAGLMLEGIRRAAALRDVDLGTASAAVVGAAGNIGSVLAAMMAIEAGSLKLVGSASPGSIDRLRAARRACLDHLAVSIAQQMDAGRSSSDLPLGSLARRLIAQCGSAAFADGPTLAARFISIVEHSGTDEENPFISLHRSIDAIRDCDLVTVATNSPEGRLVTPASVRKGAIVSCASVPSNLSGAFRDQLAEYFVFDGGYARLPDGHAIDCVGLPRDGQAFGCLSETLLLGFEGCDSSFAKGAISPGQVEQSLAMAERYGFSLGDFKLNEAIHPLPLTASAAT